MIVAGVLSGTSLDGIDVAVVDIRPRARRVLAFQTVPFAAALRARILAAYPPAALDALAFCALHADVGAAFGDAVREVARGFPLALVGSHGVTLAHDGAAGRTLQIGDPFGLRERVQTTVAYDFRAADCAAGGHGAPLVPFLDALLFADPATDRVALNLGGIANVTVLPAGGDTGAIIAFDSGPANLPIDTYVAERGLGNGRYDIGGTLALQGTIDRELLAGWLADPYFAAAPPKSTGRERFGGPFVAAGRARLDALAPPDAVATLTALSVTTIAGALHRYAPAAATVIVSGGGVHNRALMDGLRTAVPRLTFVASDVLGIAPDAKEAVLFAQLAYELVRGRAANMPKVTGARGSRLLGALAPLNLAALEATVRREEEEEMIAIGVDAGGTATVAAVSYDGTFGREARGTAGNPTTLGVEPAAAAIVATIRAAARDDAPDAVHVGAAGAARPAVARALETALGRSFPGARISVGDDAAIGLRSAIPTGPGIVLIAGTGSIAYAENGPTTARVGGHGYLLGDEGSAFAIGMAAIRLSTRVLDGRAPRDETSDLVARALGAPDRDALQAAIYDRPLDPAAVAALAPSIIAFAGKGNRASTKIVQDAAKDLGDLLKAAARGADLFDAVPPIALAGGLLRENSLLTFLIETRINGDFTGSEILRGTFEPVRGALRLAEGSIART